ncbi:MAG: type III-A CRISPR-associated RAMP protein Csm5 [Bacteroidales bacterium]|nr:type III-A CRISPR-associated RAMP protein Csm5 [Bacteroidales bacterium]
MDFKLEVLSPVNIGSGEILSQFSDYVYDDGFVYILDHELLIKKLMRGKNGEKKIDEFVKIVQNQAKGNIRDRFELKSFLTEAGLDFKQYVLRKIAVKEEIKEQIQLHLKSAGQPIIPGSSLKGAIRTALISHLFDGEEWKLQNKRNYIGEDIFGSFGNDLLKHLLIADTLPFRQQDLGIARFYNFHLQNNKADIPLVKEIITRGSVSAFSIKTTASQVELKDEFSFLQLGQEESLLPIINEYTHKNIELELKHLRGHNNVEINAVRDFYSSLLQAVEQADSIKKAYLRIGSGKTFYDNTIGQSLSDKFLRKLIQKNFKRANLDSFPITRTLIQGGYTVEVPGWIKIYKL